MKFSDTVVEHLSRTISHATSHDTPHATAHDTLHDSIHARSTYSHTLKAKILSLQGRVLQSEGMNDLAIKKYIHACTTSLPDVPWVSIGF